MPPWPPYNASRQTTAGWPWRSRVTTLAGMISKLDRKGSAVPVCRRAIPRVYFIMECAESRRICIVDSGPGRDPCLTQRVWGATQECSEVIRGSVSKGCLATEGEHGGVGGGHGCLVPRYSSLADGKGRRRGTSLSIKSRMQGRFLCSFGAAVGGDRALQREAPAWQGRRKTPRGSLCRPNELSLPTSRIKLQRGVHRGVKQMTRAECSGQWERFAFSASHVASARGGCRMHGPAWSKAGLPALRCSDGGT